ncbi:hypothetical protein BH10PSE17_BH10PSE17_36680 [soil metagenome]
MYTWFETVVVVLIVAICSWTAFVKTAPRLALRLRTRIARSLGHEVVAVSSGAGCDTGCSSCDSCGTGTADDSSSRKIVVHPRRQTSAQDLTRL